MTRRRRPHQRSEVRLCARPIAMPPRLHRPREHRGRLVVRDRDASTTAYRRDGLPLAKDAAAGAPSIFSLVAESTIGRQE